MFTIRTCYTLWNIHVHVVYLKYVVYRYYTFNDVDGELHVPLCRYILHGLYLPYVEDDEYCNTVHGYPYRMNIFSLLNITFRMLNLSYWHTNSL